MHGGVAAQREPATALEEGDLLAGVGAALEGDAAPAAVEVDAVDERACRPLSRSFAAARSTARLLSWNSAASWTKLSAIRCGSSPWNQKCPGPRSSGLRKRQLRRPSAWRSRWTSPSRRIMRVTSQRPSWRCQASWNTAWPSTANGRRRIGPGRVGDAHAVERHLGRERVAEAEPHLVEVDFAARGPAEVGARTKTPATTDATRARPGGRRTARGRARARGEWRASAGVAASSRRRHAPVQRRLRHGAAS